MTKAKVHCDYCKKMNRRRNMRNIKGKLMCWSCFKNENKLYLKDCMNIMNFNALTKYFKLKQLKKKQ